MKTVRILLALALLATACDDMPVDPYSITDDPEQEDPKKEAVVHPIRLNAAEMAVAQSGNTFGLEVFRALSAATGKENLLFSPLSLSLDLAMCAGGAAGETQSQMFTALGFADKKAEDVSGYYKKLVEGLSSVDSKTTFVSANSIWVDKHYTLKSSFVQYADTYYDADITSLDLSKKESLSAINRWCADKTKGMIDKVLDDSQDPESLFASYLLNAIYFKGLWQYLFDTDMPKGVFHAENGDVQETFLTGTRNYRYAETNDAQIVAFPYGGGLFNLVILLPKEGITLEQALSGMKESDWFSGSFHDEVTVRIPKFSITYNTEDKLIPILKNMGMQLPFLDAADFSGMFTEGDFCIGKLFQKAIIKVDEKGTEAAAVTVIGMVGTTAAEPPTLRTFIADRPFAFAITENSSSSILFLGQKRI